MASLVILKNPLSPHEREIHPLPPGLPVIDWLQGNYPLGFGMPFLGGVQNRIRNHIVPLDNVSVYRGMMKHTWSPGIIRGSTS